MVISLLSILQEQEVLYQWIKRLRRSTINQQRHLEELLVLRVEAVAKWNMIKHEKDMYRTFLYKACNLDDFDEYSTHHEYSDSTTKGDQLNVIALINNICQRRNPFDYQSTDELKSMMNIATGTKLDCNEIHFLIDCVSLGVKAREDFYKTRLIEKNCQLFDTIPKTKKRQ